MVQKGHHEAFRQGDAIEGSSDRAFGLVFSGVFAIVGAIRFFYEDEYVYLWFVAAIIFLILALLFPKTLSLFNRIWFRFGLLLNRIVNPIFMAVLFAISIVPIGISLRIFGKDLLRKKFQPDKDTYWIHRDPPGPLPKSMKNQF